jgi:CelD/BcsL family acetyltransferase involved in cellulose biosynthesis
VRELVSTANPHSCRFDLVAQDPAAAAETFLAHLSADSTWDVLRLVDVPDGGAANLLHALAQQRGYPVGTWESLQSPYIPLPATYEALGTKLSAKFKANVRRRRKKLEERGTVTVDRVDGGPELEARLEEGLRLEQSGWKGERGTAIAQDKGTRGFYSELARCASYRSALALYFMRVDGKLVAFHFALEHGGKYLLLKPAYDEAVRECSPGQLLVDEVLKDNVKRGLSEFDFLGPNMTWKQDWTEQVRVHRWLYVFRNSAYGRALCAAKFRWAPMAKELVSRWTK